MSDAFRRKAVALLRQALNDPTAQFRDGQYEAIELLTEHRDRLLIVQRTGWGKSIVYFLSTHLLRERNAGPTLLISPLLALMRNQIAAAERIGVRAATINSSNQADWPSIRQRLHANQIDILLISTERLANDEFRERDLLPIANRIGLFVVDEAHCISDWGHDFRPDYLRITRILQALPPNIPVLATTATANNRVVNDVASQLGPDLRVLRGPLVRESLQLQNIALPGQAARMAWLAEQLPRLTGSGIIYALTVRDTVRLAGWLQSQGIAAHAYHSEVPSELRERLEQQLMGNEVKALVATTALGMGYDKPDLGFVIHFQRPGSVVHYYQQVGRAGRALPQAYGIMFSGAEDQAITDYFLRTAFPLEAHVEEVLEALRTAEEGLSLAALERQINLSRGQIEKVLKTLSAKSPTPVTKIGSHYYATAVQYKPDHDKVDQLTQIRRGEQTRMEEYAQSRECLMLFLSRELDDPDPTVCGRCAVCQGKPLLPEQVSEPLVRLATQFLRRSDQPIEPRKRWPSGAFSTSRWAGSIPAESQAQVGRALCLWGDEGWGELVRRGKITDGHFDESLVSAVAEMVRERWRPTPAPHWVTSIPSLAHPELVPNFAQRLSKALNLPFVPCIEKAHLTPPQKEMENSYQQAHNLESAFSVVSEKVLSGAVLLVDDMVDSRWTFTVAAFLLRQAGSGPVFPVALAVTTKSDDG